MCGRFTLTHKKNTIAAALGADLGAVEWQPSNDIHPGDKILVIVPGLHAGLMEWGLHVSWQKHLVINARVETAAHKRTFAHAFDKRRCLVPADGFYEWHEGQRYLVRAPDRRIFSMGGLWYNTETGPRVVLLTNTANAEMRSIHDRMPLIVEEDYRERWLNTDKYRGMEFEILSQVFLPEKPYVIEPVHGPESVV